MSIIKISLFLFILSISVDGRALRKRRQTMTNQLGQDVSNFLSNGYNTIRDNVIPSISSTVNRFSQNWDQHKQDLNQGFNQIGESWDRYKQNINQGVGQINQGWNRFAQNFNSRDPYTNNNNNNYAYNQYGYNTQQYPYPMNYNYNPPPNMYQSYDGRQGNPYPANNYFNSYGQPRQNTPYYTGNVGGQSRQNMPYYTGNMGGQPRQNTPYYTGNMGGQWYQNADGQQRSNGAIAPNFAMSAYQRVGPRRK